MGWIGDGVVVLFYCEMVDAEGRTGGIRVVAVDALIVCATMGLPAGVMFERSWGMYGGGA